MKIYATCDIHGGMPSFFNEEIHGENIPADAFEITAEQWGDWLQNARTRRWIGGRLVEYVPMPQLTDLVAYAKDLSWQKEVGGILFAGIPVATDDRSKLMIAGARIDAQSDPAWTTNWDAADNTTHLIDAVTMIAISQAVSAHVNNCFAIRAAVKAGIADGSITTMAQIDAAFA